MQKYKNMTLCLLAGAMVLLSWGCIFQEVEGDGVSFTPQNVTATQGTHNDKIVVTWDASRGVNVTYKV